MEKHEHFKDSVPLIRPEARSYIEMISCGAEDCLRGELDPRVFARSCYQAALHLERLLNETLTQESKKE